MFSCLIYFVFLSFILIALSDANYIYVLSPLSSINIFFLFLLKPAFNFFSLLFSQPAFHGFNSCNVLFTDRDEAFIFF